MKIALLSFEYPPETGFGGIGTYTWYHAKALVRLGHTVHVFAGATSPCVLSTLVSDSVTVHRFHSPSATLSRVSRLLSMLGCHWTRQRLQNAWNMFSALRQLRNRYSFDLLEMPECGAEGAFLTWMVRSPTIVRFHSPAQFIMPFYKTSKIDRVLCAGLEKLAICGATALTSCSLYLAREVTQEMNVERTIATIPNGIDLQLFDGEGGVQTDPIGRSSEATSILFIGRLEPRKGIQLCTRIIRLIAAQRNAQFLFAGDDLFGYFHETLKPQLESMNLLGSVRYLGKLNLDELRSYVKSVDICLLPSLWENCPYACLEAMAAGRAIVCSAQGGFPELIEHGVNGLIAEMGSPDAFAAQLLLLIDNKDLRNDLGTAARSAIEERYTDHAVAIQATDLYKRFAKDSTACFSSS